MTRQDLYKEMVKLTPSNYSGQQSFIEHLSNMFDKYLTLLSEFDEKDIQIEWPKYVEKIREYCQAIEEVIRLYYSGLYFQAYNVLKGQIERLPKWRINHKRPFYRMRVVDEGTVPTYEGMFHIAFDKRGIIKTQRYSAPGFPCLYLGILPSTCWEEMDRPDLRKTFVSLFQPEGFYSFLKFSVPNEQTWMTGERKNIVFMNDLEYFPFVIASMVIVRNKYDVFKPEYIIPQLVMQWLIENRRGISQKDKSSIHIPIGVIYTSVHYNVFDAGQNDLDYINIAVPAYYNSEHKYSTALRTFYSYTDPILCSDGAYEDDVQKNRDRLLAIWLELNNREEYPLKKLT